MKRLILIRHAKSSWDDLSAGDHARVLNARGREGAAAIGTWLEAQGYIPEHIYSSDAARTRETTARVVGAILHKRPVTPDISHLDILYHAPPATLMKVLRRAQGDTIAIVAHNPGIALFAEEIVAQPPKHARFFDYPTGAALVCDLPINDWAEAVPRSGQVVDFVVPKDLA